MTQTGKISRQAGTAREDDTYAWRVRKVVSPFELVDVVVGNVVVPGVPSFDNFGASENAKPKFSQQPCTNVIFDEV